MQCVVRSSEFRRVESLPRREWEKCTTVAQAVDVLTQEYKTPNGTQTLRPHQAAALLELHARRGLFAPLGVGSGKTLITQLAPLVLESQRPLLLLPAALKKVTVANVLPDLRKHWRTHPALRIESYEGLSVISGQRMLEDYEPDLIIADECHALARAGSARTKRFARYMRAHPDVVFCALSGTVTRRSILDYAQIITWALRSGAPLPASYSDLVDWSRALDEGVPHDQQIAPGALVSFCTSFETAREGYARRLTQTPGVIATRDSALGTSLYINRITQEHLPPPEEITRALTKLRATWETPGGEQITDALDMWRKSQELSLGYYYRWQWQNDTPDEQWLRARAEWRAFVRHAIAHQRKPPLDSELQVHNACASGALKSCGVFEAWQEQRTKPPPPVVPVWFCDHVIRCLSQFVVAPDTLIWSSSQAVSERLVIAHGWPYFGPGDKNAVTLLSHLASHTSPVIVSLQAHGTGKNLQTYAHNLIVTPPSSGAIWEQLLGRTHRPGQLADEVRASVLVHTPELFDAFEQARKTSLYIEQTTNQTQKLSYAVLA